MRLTPSSTYLALGLMTATPDLTVVDPDMKTEDSACTYRVWGADNIAYGPVELTTLAAWAKDDRVTAESWVFLDNDHRWLKAAELPELHSVIKAPTVEVTAPGSTGLADLKLGTLRRVKLLATMDERQLASFAGYLEVIRYKQFSIVVWRSGPRRCDVSDSRRGIARQGAG